MKMRADITGVSGKGVSESDVEGKKTEGSCQGGGRYMRRDKYEESGDSGGGSDSGRCDEGPAEFKNSSSTHPRFAY